MSSESGDSVVEVSSEELQAPMTEAAQRLEIAAGLQKILDSAVFHQSVEYATLRKVKRAANPGIKFHSTRSKDLAKSGLLESVRRIWNRATPESDICNGHFIPLPLNEVTAKELMTMMHPIPIKGSSPGSWCIDADEFSLHDHQDWKEQVMEVKADACRNLGISRELIDRICVTPKYVMLHIGDGSQGHTAWDSEFAAQNSDGRTFGVLRFVLPSARSNGHDRWILGDDSIRDRCSEAAEFRTYYIAHYVEVEHKIASLSGVRLELIYLLQHPANELSVGLTAPTVQQSVIHVLKSWSRLDAIETPNPWIVCTLQHREQRPQNEALDVARLNAIDRRKVQLLTRLSTSWRSQFFLAHITIVKKWSKELEDIECIEVRVGRLGGMDGTELDPPSSIPFDQISLMTDVEKLPLEACEREISDNGYIYYQYLRVAAFLWPNKSHGRHVEPLTEGDKFLQKWLSDKELNYNDARQLKFGNAQDEFEFSSIALSLCRRGSSMKPFCLEAGLKILHPALFEAALPTTRTVDVIRRGVRRLGFDAMKPIIMRTLDIGVPDDIFEWCDYLIELRRLDLRGAMQMIDKLIHRMAKFKYISGIVDSRPNPIIETVRFFYLKHLPDTCERLIRQIPYNCHQFWLPFIPQLRVLCNELKLMGGLDRASTWVDMSLTALANYHSLPTPEVYLLEHPNQPLIPTTDFPYIPPTIQILGLCAEYGRTDLVRNVFRRILRAIMSPQSLLRCQLEVRIRELRFLKAIVISSYNALKSTDTAFYVDPHGMFYGLVFTKYLLPALGRRPARHGFSNIECQCVFCIRINDFLKSGELEKSLQIPWPGHKTFHHIVDNLPPRDDLSLSRDPKSQPPGIILKKVDSEAMEQWDNERRDLKELLKFLKPKKVVRTAWGELHARVDAALKQGSNGWEWGIMESTVGDWLEWQGNKRRAEAGPGGPRKRVRTG